MSLAVIALLTLAVAALARALLALRREHARVAAALAESRDRLASVAAAEAEIRQQREILAQNEKLAAMGQLLAGVAHELNNPLSVVIGRAELLHQLLGTGPLAAHAERVAEAAERCGRIVRNFLALARRRPTRHQRVDLGGVVHEALELLLYRLRVDNVEIAVDVAPELPTLWADPHQLHQVVVNLVTNAHQAMRAATAPRRLSISAGFDATRRLGVLRVADTGPGIPAEIRARIFEPFFTTKPPGQGTGLGLSLCQGIVEGHGGTIRIESAPGAGAVFVVELPVQSPPEREEQAVRRGAAVPVRGMTVLVVDDEPEVATLLRDALAAGGSRVEIAPNGAAALERLASLACDVILCDIKMPELDGPGLFRAITHSHPELVSKIVFLTGDALSPESRQFIDTTGVPCLNKPFHLGEIFDAIRALERGAARSLPAAF